MRKKDIDQSYENLTMCVRNKERNWKAFFQFYFSRFALVYKWTKCIYNLKVIYFQYDTWVLFISLKGHTVWTSPVVRKSFHQQALFNLDSIAKGLVECFSNFKI